MPYTADNGFTVYYIGEPETTENSYKSKTGQVQNFSEIIKTHNASSPFQDAEFPHTVSSVGNLDLFDSASQSYQNLIANGWNGQVDWMRVGDWVRSKSQALGSIQGEPTPSEWRGVQPVFIADGLNKQDIMQGSIGDCWFVAALSEITIDAELANFVIPADNANNNNSGAYHFRMWYRGQWIDIVVDDYLPVIRLKYGIINLLGSGIKKDNNNKAETWVALAEKAYAKLNGSFSNLAGNQPRYAFEALTGGIGEFINLTETTPPPNLFEYIQNTLCKRTFVVFWTAGNVNKAEGKSKGILYDHAYSVTGTTTVNYLGQAVQLIRLRNPHGKSEWTGRWSDQNIDGVPGLAAEWKYVSQAEKDAIGLVSKNEGEFWMQYEDAVKFFYQIDICYWIAPSEVNQPNSKANMFTYQGKWRKANKTAGGQNRIWENPQYVIDVSDDSGYNCGLILSILFKAGLKDKAGALGLRIYPVYDSVKQGAPFGQAFFGNTYPLPDPNEGTAVVAGVLTNAVGYLVPAGKYVVVPFLYQFMRWDDISEGDFCLRVITQKGGPDQSCDLAAASNQ